MLRRLIWVGIVIGLTPLYMGVACGGYEGWPGQNTSGVDAKVNQELSVSSNNPLESGLFTYYVNYNDDTAPGMTTVSTYVDHTAPFAFFTTDGNGTQHFNSHVGTGIAIGYDKNKDGVICWIGCPFEAGDYTLSDAFCPALGGTGSSGASSGFSAYCDKGQWETLVASTFFTETKQKASGTRFANSKYGNFTPFGIAQVLATSTPLPNGSGGVTTTVSGVSLPSGASHTLTTPISASVYGFGSGIAINADQAGLIEAANWLSQQWAGQPDGFTNVTLSFNGGAASLSFQAASGHTASIVLAKFAATH